MTDQCGADVENVWQPASSPSMTSLVVWGVKSFRGCTDLNVQATGILNAVRYLDE